MIIKDKYIDMAWDRADMVEIFDEFHSGVLKKQGTRYKGCCVYHNDKSPSMYVSNAYNNVHCFSCGTHHTVFSFLMEELGCGFNDAVIWLLKRYCQDVDLKDIWQEQKEEDVQLQKLRDAQKVAVSAVQKFFVECYHADTPEAKACRDYAESRWGKEFCEEYGIGYAPGGGHALIDWAKNKGYNIQTLIDTGMISEEIHDDVKTGRLYDFYSNRLTIPQKDRWTNVVAFSARRMSDRQKQKYINNRCTEKNLIYKKGEYAFGTDVAMKAARLTKKLYLMEGAPDVMTLFSNKILNACASNGGYWTKEQLMQFRKYVNTLCFVPDEDEGMVMVGETMMRKGEAFVVRSAKIAIELGFSVSVRELPSVEGEKVDVGTYVHTQEDWNQLRDEDFVLWYARKRLSENTSREEQSMVMNEVCDMVSLVKNETLRDTYISDLKKEFKFVHSWKKAIAEADKRLMQNKDKEALEEGEIDLAEYGFRQKSRHYYIVNAHGVSVDISNFKISPLYYIDNGERSVRIFEIWGEKNSKARIIEMPYTSVTKLDKFRNEIEMIGNYHFMGTQAQYELFKSYLLDSAVEAQYINTIGWNETSKDGFYAFANGVVYNGDWLPVDQNGIVCIDDKPYYLPAFSDFNKNKAKFYTNMRRFEHRVDREVGIDEIFGLMEKVYGSRAVVSLMYCIASMFRDVIIKTTRSFPILYLFGQKGTGKTEFAITLSRFFQRREEINDLTNTSLYSISNKLESICNGIVHLDEYKHTLPNEKIELLKGVYDSSGRTTKADNFDERTQTSVECGIIVTGSDIPDDDPALLTRTLFLEAFSAIRDNNERELFRKLKDVRDDGLTGITISILKYRKQFESHFKSAWRDATAKIKALDTEKRVEERLLECWSIPYAVALCFRSFGVELPFSRKKVFDACAEGLQRQEEVTHKTDEMADFWSLMMTAVNQRKLYEDSDFRIEKLNHRIPITNRRVHSDIDPSTNPETMIFIRANSCFPVIKSLAMATNRMKQGASTLDFYVLSSDECLGTTVNPMKFDKVDALGNIIRKTFEDDKSGKTYSRKQTVQERGLVFDYDRVKAKYAIDLHTYLESIPTGNNKETA